MTLMGRLGYLSSANAVMEPSSRQIADNRIGPNDFIAILRHQEGVLSTVGSRALLRDAFSLLGKIEHVVRVGISGDAGNSRRLNVAGNDMQFIADDSAGEAVAGDAHARQALIPCVISGIVSFEGPERSLDLVVLEFSAGNINAALVDATGHAATRRRHLPLGRPQILGHVIFLVDVGIARPRYESRTESSADRIDLAVDRGAEKMIARGWHRRTCAPAILRRIVFLVDADAYVVWLPVEADRRIARARQAGGSADHVDLAVDRHGNAAATLGRQWSDRLPAIGGRRILPGIVDRLPGDVLARAHEAAEDIDLVVERDRHAVMHMRLRHRTLLRPALGGRIIDIDYAHRLET